MPLTVALHCSMVRKPQFVPPPPFPAEYSAHARRIDRGRPVIIDGVLVLDALDQIRRKADFLIFVTGGHTGSTLASQIADYQRRQRLSERANFTIDGYEESFL